MPDLSDLGNLSRVKLLELIKQFSIFNRVTFKELSKHSAAAFTPVSSTNLSIDECIK